MYICVYICIYGTRMEQEWHMNGTRITLFTQIIHPYLSQESPHELTSNEWVKMVPKAFNKCWI